MKKDSRKLAIARVRGLVVRTAIRAGNKAKTAEKQAEATDALIRG